MFPTQSLSFFRFGTFLATLVLTTSGPAASEQYIWRVYESRDSVAIVYGTPKSDDVVLVVLCERKTSSVQVNPYLGTRGVKKDGPATIVLSSSGGEVRVPGRTVFRPISGTFIVEGRMRSDPALPAVFEGVGTLLIEIPGLRETVPLNKEAAHAASRFRALCPVRRG